MTVAAQHNPQTVIQDYLLDRASRDWPVSVASAVRSIRKTLPECSLTDRALAEMVEVAAVHGGHCVAFDAGRPQEDHRSVISIEAWLGLGR